MWRPVQMSGAAFGECGCGCNGFAGAPRRYPAIEQALRSYIGDKTAAGQYFHISPALNTGAVAQGGFGGLGASFLDTGSDPSASSDPITALSTDIGNVFSQYWGDGTSPGGAASAVTLDPSGSSGTWTSDFQQLANLVNPAPLSLPSDAVPPVAAAAQTDIFGAPLSPLLIGGAAVAVLVVALALSAPRGKRRRR